MTTKGDAALDIAPAAVHPVPTPLVLDESTIWKPHHLFVRRTAGMYRWSAHVSALAPGATPHPPHTHKDEEILMLLAGEVDIIVPEASAAASGRLHLHAGQFVYYPSGFPHTLQTTSPDAANYLMFRWSNLKAARDSDELRFGVFDPWGVAPVDHAQTTGLTRATGRRTDTSDESGGSLAYLRVFEGPTRFLPRLQCHVSTLAGGGGYPPHADPYDVAIVLLEGEVETLGQRVGPRAVIAYPAGASHGIHNPVETTARYVVFEFQGRTTPYWMQIRRALRRLPRRALRKARRVLSARRPGR